MQKLLDRFFKPVLFILLILVLTGLIFKYFNWKESGTVLIISLSALAYLFAAKGMFGYQRNSPRQIQFVSFSILMIAFLFYVQHWEGASTMLIVGGAAFGASLILFLVKQRDGRT